MTARTLFASHRSHTLFVVAIVVAAVFVLVPILAVRFPPINDYPFHLARMAILSRLDDPILARFYQQGSFLLPNLGMDAIAVPLSHLLGAEWATRAVLELILIGMLFGTVALHAVAHGRISLWPLFAIVVLHNGIFRFGFFNYLLGLGLAFGAAALWMAMKPGLARLGMALFASILLVWCHFEAFGIFAVIVGSIEIYGALAALAKTGWPRTLGTLFYSAAPFLVAIALFVLMSPTAGVAGKGIAYPIGFLTKPVSGLYSLSSGILWLDLVSIGSVAALGLWLAIRRELIVSLPLAFATAMMVLTYIVLPDGIMGAVNVDVRIGPAVALLAIAALDFRTREQSGTRIAAFGLVLALVVLRAAALTTTWSGYDREISGIVAAIDKLEPGSTLFAATTQEYTKMIADSPRLKEAWEPPLKHVSSYAVLGSPVFVPMTWAEPTQQPLLVTPSYRPAYVFQGNNPRKVYDAAAFSQFVSEIRTNLDDGAWPGLGQVYLLVVAPKPLEPLALPASVSRAAENEMFVLLRFDSAQRKPAQD